MSRIPPAKSGPVAQGPPWLDRLPAWIALPLAMVLGFGVGWGLLAWPLVLPLVLVIMLFLLALAGAAVLALQGSPLLAGDLPPPARPRRLGRRPRLVPDDWWVPIPSGEFSMGSADDEPGRDHDEGRGPGVHISAFECLRFPVTRGLVRRAQGGRRWSFGRDDGYPVVDVSWHDAIELCNRLSDADGRTPCYRIDAEQVHWDGDADGWRLLTEAEWEYACRAGTTTRWSFGDDEARLGEHAWYSENAGGALRPVGRKRPNPWGLHDMHGLVWEWCWDWYGPYPADVASDPMGPASGSSRVLRGGAFDVGAELLRSAVRDWGWPGYRLQFLGFRCARAPRRQF